MVKCNQLTYLPFKGLNCFFIFCGIVICSYTGRTQKQLLEYVRENCVKRPEFHRLSSSVHTYCFSSLLCQLMCTAM